jgi:hypothetical protein
MTTVASPHAVSGRQLTRQEATVGGESHVRDYHVRRYGFPPGRLRPWCHGHGKYRQRMNSIDLSLSG